MTKIEKKQIAIMPREKIFPKDWAMHVIQKIVKDNFDIEGRGEIRNVCISPDFFKLPTHWSEIWGIIVQKHECTRRD